MDEAAGFHFERIGTGVRGPSSLVLLHGSGGSETSLVDFAHSIAPDRAAFVVRGGVPWESGYAFFRRNPDRSLNWEDLGVQATAFCDLLGHLNAAGHPKPVLVGYSNGAIIAAAAALQAFGPSSGAVLLRPLSPDGEASFEPLRGYPVLLLGGTSDDRRVPADTPHLAEQFLWAGALVTVHLLPTGHALTQLGPSAGTGVAGRQSLVVGRLSSHPRSLRPVPQHDKSSVCWH
jgi:phospholipase/carboxylesterase